VTEEDIAIIDNFITTNDLVIKTKHAIKDAKAAHQNAVKNAALADIAYRDLVKKREEYKNAAQ
jgi:hypothetical protein